MFPLAAIIHGTLNADGTLHLDEAPALAPGRVQILVQSLPNLPADDPFWQRMQSVWSAQDSSGHIARSVEEIKAQSNASREEWDERSAKLEALHLL